MAQMIKDLPAMQEIQFQSLDWEDPLDEIILKNGKKGAISLWLLLAG